MLAAWTRLPGAHGRAGAAVETVLGWILAALAPARSSALLAEGRSGRRARTVTAGTMLVLLLLPAGAMAAINEPPKAPHNIIVFPERDFISATGYAATDVATVEVFRNSLLIGRATGVVPQDDPKTTGFDGLVEVNHPGGGCWGDGPGSPNTTPDILPGDVARITTAPNTGDQTTTAN